MRLRRTPLRRGCRAMAVTARLKPYPLSKLGAKDQARNLRRIYSGPWNKLKRACV